jgi:hypothetical protein
MLRGVVTMLRPVCGRRIVIPTDAEWDWASQAYEYNMNINMTPSQCVAARIRKGVKLKPMKRALQSAQKSGSVVYIEEVIGHMPGLVMVSVDPATSVVPQYPILLENLEPAGSEYLRAVDANALGSPPKLLPRGYEDLRVKYKLDASFTRVECGAG